MVHLKDKLDIPIFHKTYELYKALYLYQKNIPKSARYTLWQKCENTTISILEGFMIVSHYAKDQRSEKLKVISCKLDMLRVYLRLSYETKVIDLKKYTILAEIIDEIGRMLGGWLKGLKP